MSPLTLTAAGSSLPPDGVPLRGRPGAERRDVVGSVWLALAVGLAAWIVVAGLATPASIVTSLLVVASIGSLSLARRVGRRWPTVVPAAVAVIPLSLSVLTRLGPASGGPLEYANASAALFFVAAGGALLMFVRARRNTLRLVAALLFTVNALAAWSTDSYAAALLTLALPVALLVVRSGGSPATRRWLAIAASCVLGAVAVTVVLGATYQPGEREGPVDRLVDATLTERRVQLWSDALTIIAERPLTGVGPGTFRETSPTAIANPDTAPAHSEFLQLGAETGVAGGLLAMAVVMFALVRLGRSPPGAGTVVAAAVVAGLGVHASMDYVLHFPAVPLAAAALLGAELGGSHASRRREEPPQARAAGRGPVPISYLASGILVAVVLVPWGPVNPPVYGSNGAVIDEDGWIGFDTPGLVRSARAPRDMYDRIATTNAFSVELWVRSGGVEQHGPARLVSSSGGTGERNFTIGQQGDDLVVRLRTSRHDPNGTDSDLHVPDVLGDLEAHHLAVVVDGPSVTVHVDGRVRAWQVPPDVDLASWDPGLPMVLGNEIGGDRPWIGAVREVRVYDVALPLRGIPDRFLLGPAAAPQGGAEPVAWYRMEQGGSRIPDRAFDGLGGPLHAPELIRHVPRGLAAVAGDTTQHEPLLTWDGWRSAWTGRSTRALRIILTFVLFVAWAIVIAPGVAGRWRAGRSVVSRSMVTVLGAGTLAAAVEYMQYVQGRSPSAVDVLVGSAGAAVGLAWMRRPSARPRNLGPGTAREVRVHAALARDALPPEDHEDRAQNDRDIEPQ